MAAKKPPRRNTYAAIAKGWRQQLHDPTGQVGLKRRSSNLFRDRERASKPRLDVRDSITSEKSTAAGWADARALTPYENLVLATLACGAMPRWWRTQDHHACDSSE